MHYDKLLFIVVVVVAIDNNQKLRLILVNMEVLFIHEDRHPCLIELGYLDVNISVDVDLP
jgi:hypothetical protein